MTDVVRCGLTLFASLTCVCLVETAPAKDDESPAQLQITVRRSELSLQELEREYALPLESVVRRLPFVEDDETEIREGQLRLVITLTQDTAVPQALSQLQAAVVNTLTALDLEPEVLTIERMSSERDAFWVLLQSPKLEHDSTIAAAAVIRSKLERVTDVGSVTVIGTPRRVIDVTVDAGKSRAHSLSPRSVYEFIERHVFEDRAGQKQELPVIEETRSLTALSRSLPDLVLAQSGGIPTRLKDIAMVSSGLLFLSEARLNRERVIAFEVRTKQGSGRDLASRIEEKMTDWIADAAGEGTELRVLKPELAVEFVIRPDNHNAHFNQILELAGTRIQQQLKMPVDLLFTRTGSDANHVRLSLSRSNADDRNPVSSHAIREILTDLPGVSVYVTELRNHSADPIELRILGANLEVLQNAARQASAQIRTIDGVEELRMNGHRTGPEVLVKIKREAAARLGVKIADLGTSMRVIMSPQGPQDLLDAGVRLRFPEYTEKQNRFEEMPITTEEGRTIPLSAVADIHQAQRPLVIRRRNGSRMVKLIVLPTSHQERQRIEREVRTIGENLRSGDQGDEYVIKVE